MERAVFRAGLEHKRPMIWVKPWGIDVAVSAATACRGPVDAAIAEGRLLVVSPFDAAVEAPSARRAVWCNQYVLAHCNRLVVGHLKPDGMLACILAESDPNMEVVYL
jgi:hypothetical protein